MAKDRAAPFSKKHRRYWLPVTGGMILIGLVNVGIGLCSYDAPRAPDRMEVKLRDASVDAPGTLALSQLPLPVMTAYNTRYPRTLPRGAARASDGTYRLALPPGGAHATVTFRADGTLVRED